MTLRLAIALFVFLSVGSTNAQQSSFTKIIFNGQGEDSAEIQLDSGVSGSFALEGDVLQVSIQPAVKVRVKCPNPAEDGLCVIMVDSAEPVFVDADGDGVDDSVDECLGTPPSTTVNEVGCGDSDGDGVFDNNDLCPNTPTGDVVNTSTGCTIDSSGDLYAGACAGTPSDFLCSETKNFGSVSSTGVQQILTLTGKTGRMIPWYIGEDVSIRYRVDVKTTDTLVSGFVWRGWISKTPGGPISGSGGRCLVEAAIPNAQPVNFSQVIPGDNFFNCKITDGPGMYFFNTAIVAAGSPRDGETPVKKTYMRQKTDANGNPVVDGNGDPVMEEVTENYMTYGDSNSFVFTLVKYVI